jgi:DNA end-binding protein Ku
MAQRPIWRGHLRLALVSCPIGLYTAERASGDLHFHFINPKTGNRVRMVTLDAGTEEEVSRRDLVRGYEFKKDTYVLLENEDFERAKIETSSTLTVDKFVDAKEIDPIYFDQSYYVAPDGESGEDVYIVLRDAIRQTGRVALSRVVIARRERAVAIMPMDRGLVLHTLHEQRDLYNPKDLFANVPDAKPDAEMVKLAIQLVERQAAEFEASDMEDRYEARLREVIEAKLKGEGETMAPEEPERESNVIDLMAALKKSLGQATAPERRPAAASERPAPAKKAPARKAAAAKSSTPSRSAAKKPARKRA